MHRLINVREFHKPLMDAGLVPQNCTVLEIAIGIEGAFRVRYEVLFTPEQTMAFGLVLQQVAVRAVEHAMNDDDDGFGDSPKPDE